MTSLTNKRIVLGITGGIASYKMAEFVRRAMDEGATIDVVMTQSATKFIAPTTFQALTGRPVWVDIWDDRAHNNMAHINLTRGASAIIIAPATANFIAKVAHGFADDLLSTLCSARGDCPLLMAPAMNCEMWDNPPNQRNIDQALADGVILLGPAQGDQACGENGSGRMLEPHQILSETIAFFQPNLLEGKNVLITAGPTSEPIDPVRVITNKSSGKTGYLLAQAAQQAGAKVTMVSGPTNLSTPHQVKRIDIETAIEMHAAVMDNIQDTDIFISVAAVADWRVANPSDSKHKKSAEGGPAPELEFEPNPDILAEVAKLPNAPYCVGFAAETENLMEYASAKRIRKGVPLLFGNLVQDSMNKNDTELVIFDDLGYEKLAKQSKNLAAQQLIKAIAERINPQD